MNHDEYEFKAKNTMMNNELSIGPAEEVNLKPLFENQDSNLIYIHILYFQFTNTNGSKIFRTNFKFLNNFLKSRVFNAL